MVTENMAVAVGNNPNYLSDEGDALDKYIDADTVNPDELGGFESIDDLEEFLAKFTGDETEVHTQTPADIDGTPVTTVH